MSFSDRVLLLKDFLWGGITNKLLGHLTHVPLCVVGGIPQIDKILVAIDASEGAMRAVNYAGTMANSTSWEASRHLEKASFNHNQITTRVVVGVTSRAVAISVEALSGGYGIIVVGRRGLSKVEEFTMGHVINKVIHMAREIAVWVVA